MRTVTPLTLLGRISQLESEYREELALFKAEKAEDVSIKQIRTALRLLNKARNNYPDVDQMLLTIDKADSAFADR